MEPDAIFHMKPLRVAGRRFQGIPGTIHRIEMQIRPFRSQGDGDTAAPGSQVCNLGCTGGEKAEAQVDQLFRLRPGDQDPGIDMELPAVELLLPGDVLERLPAGPAPDAVFDRW